MSFLRTYDGQYTPWLAHGNAGAQGRCDRGQRWLGGRPASRLRRQAVFFLPTRYPARKPAVSSRIPPMAIPKTPNPPVSSVAAVSGVDDTVASTAAAGAVVAVGAGVLAGDAVSSTVALQWALARSLERQSALVQPSRLDRARVQGLPPAPTLGSPSVLAQPGLGKLPQSPFLP